VRGMEALTSCRQVAPGSNLGHGWRIRAETLTFLRDHQASWSDWRKSSLPPPTGCRAELEIRLRLSKWHCASGGAVQGVRELHSADERECRSIPTVFRDLGQLPLEVTDVRFVDVALPHFDSKKMVVIPLSLPARCILGEECLGYLLEVGEGLRGQRIEPI